MSVRFELFCYIVVEGKRFLWPTKFKVVDFENTWHFRIRRGLAGENERIIVVLHVQYVLITIPCPTPRPVGI